jgi:hypothetical protein
MKLVQSLQAEVAHLKERNKALAEQLDKKKKELAAAKRPSVTSLRRPLSAPGKPEVEIVAGPNPKLSTHVPHPEPSGEKDTKDWFAIAQQLKAR